jgi:hypothetical protein
MTQTGPINFPSLPAGTDLELVTIDLGSAKPIAAIDLYDCVVSGSGTCALQLYGSNDGVLFDPLGVGASVYQTARHVRVAAAPSQVADFRYVRINIVDTAAVTGETLSASAATVLEQEAPTDQVRFWPFSGAEDRAYMLVLTGRNADVFRDGRYVASVPLPHNASQILRLRRDKRLDTAIAWHENVPPHRVFRDGDDFSWISAPAVFENLPDVQFDGETYSNGKNEIQRINFRDFDQNDTFNILLDGERTSSISIPDQYNGIEGNVKTALEALPNLGSGQTIVTRSGTREVTIEFVGAAGQIDWPEMFVTVVDSATGIATVSTVREGEEGGEPIASEARGYFRCGLFWSGRTNQFGAKELPLNAIASAYGQYFDFNQGSNRATDGLEYVIDGQDDDGVRAALKARYPLLFTTSGVYYIPVDALDGEVPPGAIEATNYGFEDIIQPMRFDGSAVYVQQGGNIVRELYWQGGNVGQGGGWLTTDLSLRASHLIISPIDACVREAGRLNQTNVLFIVCGNGEAATLTSLEEQSVRGWARDNTPNGKILAAGADKLGRVYYAIRREIDGNVAYTIETEESDRYLDGSVQKTVINSNIVDGLEHLEGHDVLLLELDELLGPFKVEAGQVVLPEEKTGKYEVGTFYDAWAQMLDLRNSPDGKSLANRKKLIHRVEAKVLDSLAPRIEHNGKDWPLQPSDEEVLTDVTVAAELRRYSAYLEVEGLQGHTRDVDFKLKRSAPGPFHILSIKVAASIQ